MAAINDDIPPNDGPFHGEHEAYASNGRSRTEPAKELPHDPDAEGAVLGGVLLDNAVLDLVPDLEVDHFYDPRHKAVFGSMRNLEAAKSPIDLVTLASNLTSTGKFEAIGGHALLGELILRVPAAENVPHYARIVRDKYVDRAMMLSSSQMAAVVGRGNLAGREAIEELIGELQRLVELHPTETAKPRWATPFVEFIGDAEPDDDDSEEWILRDLMPRGMPSLIAGPPKSGKTWILLDLAICIALGEPWLGGAFENTVRKPMRVIAVCFEDSQRQLRKRIWELCRAHDVSPNDTLIRDNLIVSQEALTLPSMRDARAFAAEMKKLEVGAALVDNISRVMEGDQNSTRDVTAFTKSWSGICKAGGLNTTFLHHTTKTMMGPADQVEARDPFDAVRGSGDFIASSRNNIVTRKIEFEGKRLTDLRIRGNLDLRREALALQFERSQIANGRWIAKLSDAGHPDDLRAEIKKAKRETRMADKQAELAKAYGTRREIALRIVHERGNVTSATLGPAIGSSPNTALKTLQAMESEGALARGANRNIGYVLPTQTEMSSDTAGGPQ